MEKPGDPCEFGSRMQPSAAVRVQDVAVIAVVVTSHSGSLRGSISSLHHNMGAWNGRFPTVGRRTFSKVP